MTEYGLKPKQTNNHVQANMEAVPPPSPLSKHGYTFYQSQITSIHSESALRSRSKASTYNYAEKYAANKLTNGRVSNLTVIEWFANSCL